MRRPTTLSAVRAWFLALAVVGSALASVAACGDDGDLGADRADQVRSAALESGLPEEVADVLALAARGTTATYRVTYPGTGGASVIISQDPPDHRLDIVAGEVVVESHVIRDGITYRCTPPEGAAPGDPLECERSDAAVERSGSFSDAALDAFAASLAGSLDDFDLTVEERTIADTAATCLVAAPKAGTPIDGEGPGVDTLCLSPEGAQLLTDTEGERLVADTYTTEVPDGTFDV